MYYKLWIENTDLPKSEIEEATTPAWEVLTKAGVRPEQAHAEYTALVEAGDHEAIEDCLWRKAERALGIEDAQLELIEPIDFFPLDFFLCKPDRPDPQEVANATGLTIICDEDAAVSGNCWWATLARPDRAEISYWESGGTVSTLYAPTWR